MAFAATVRNGRVTSEKEPKLEDLLDRGAKLYAAGNSLAAAQVYRAALKQAPDDPTVRLRHAIAIWHGENRAEEALSEIRQLAKFFPQATVLAHEGLILNSLGRFEEGAIAARRALDVDPDYSSAWLDLATAVSGEDAEALVVELEMRLSRSPTPKVSRDLNFALAQALRKTGDHDGAFEACSNGNALSAKRWDADREAAFHAILREIFDAEMIGRLRDAGSDDDHMIFITGMPRSGTTLLDRLLSAHPGVASVGETTTVGALFNQLFAQTGRSVDGVRNALSGKVLSQLAGAYLHAIQQRLRGNPPERIVDKMPANTMFWPLIALMFPKASILHMQRHPLGTALSCWEASFAFGLDYATDMTALGQAYRQYADLTDHWVTLVPDRIHSVVYEDLVSHPEQVMKGVLDVVGLPWDERCLTPDASGVIKTASLAQARAPVGTDSVDRWRSYANRLLPVENAMGGGDWMDERWDRLSSAASPG